MKLAKLLDLLQTLNLLTDNGIDFQDAVWSVTKEYHLTDKEVDKLTDLYDNQ